MRLDMLIMSNLTLGVVFATIAVVALYLFARRHKQWSPVWGLLLVAVACGSCAVARVVHSVTYYLWPAVDTSVMTFADCIAAALGVPSVIFLIVNVNHILRVPTTERVKSLEKQAAHAQLSAAVSVELARLNETYQHRLEGLKSVLMEYANVDPEFREKVFQVIEDIK